MKRLTRCFVEKFRQFCETVDLFLFCHDSIQLSITLSQLCKDYLSSFVARMGDSLRCTPIAMKSIPIPEYNEETAPLYQQIGNITKRIFDLKKEDIQADTAQLENELESLVKELYKIKPSESRQAAYISPTNYRQLDLQLAYS